MPQATQPGGRPNVVNPAQPLSYKDRISRLKGRLDNKGANKQNIRGRIQDVRSQRYLSQKANAPDPTLPFNAEYDQTVSGLARNRDVALQNDAYERQQTTDSYGFDNPLANPYSRAAILQRSYNQANQGTLNSAAASGQLYSGSTQVGLDEGLFNFGQQYDASQREYQNALRGLTDKDLAAQNEYEEGVKGAEDKRLSDALATDVDPSTTPDLPNAVKKYIKGQRKDLRHLQKKGRDNQADKLRQKLKELGVLNGRR
jgi:hypothetical protein